MHELEHWSGRAGVRTEAGHDTRSVNLPYAVQSGWSRSRVSQVSCAHPPGWTEEDTHTSSMRVPTGAGDMLMSRSALGGESWTLRSTSTY